MTKRKDIDCSEGDGDSSIRLDDLGLSPKDRRELEEALAESLKEYDQYLREWSAEIEKRLRQNDARKAENRKQSPRTKRRQSKTAKPKREQTKAPRKKGKGDD